MIEIVSKGEWKKTRYFLERLLHGDIYADLDRYGQLGVSALASATPVRTGLTAASWRYKIIEGKNGPTVEWYNTNIEANGTPVAILLQYGHGTRNGGYVQGRNFINPAIRPIFDQMADDVWKKVKYG